MADKKKREQRERSFIEAGLFYLCGVDPPSIHIPSSSMKDSHQKVYRALCSAAQKLSKRELIILGLAFDGMDENCSHLVEERSDSNV